MYVYMYVVPTGNHINKSDERLHNIDIHDTSTLNNLFISHDECQGQKFAPTGQQNYRIIINVINTKGIYVTEMHTRCINKVVKSILM